MGRARLAALLLVVLAAGVVLAGCAATSGEAITDARTVEVRMVDLAFEMDDLAVSPGETIRFVFRNDGQLPHDAFIGDEAAQVEHGEEMEEMAGHDMGGDPDSVTVQPGETAELVHTFTEGGRVQIGCHQPGHFEAGMVIDLPAA